MILHDTKGAFADSISEVCRRGGRVVVSHAIFKELLRLQRCYFPLPDRPIRLSNGTGAQEFYTPIHCPAKISKSRTSH